MFRAVILPIFRSTRLCVTVCGIMHPRCCRPKAGNLVGCLYYLHQWCTVRQISDSEIYLLIKYTKSVLWRVAKRLSYTEDARCLKVNFSTRLYRRHRTNSSIAFSANWRLQATDTDRPIANSPNNFSTAHTHIPSEPAGNFRRWGS